MSSCEKDFEGGKRKFLGGKKQERRILPVSHFNRLHAVGELAC